MCNCDSPSCGDVHERRQRPRLEKSNLIFYQGVPHYYRGTFYPSFRTGDWIEYIPDPTR